MSQETIAEAQANHDRVLRELSNARDVLAAVRQRAEQEAKAAKYKIAAAESEVNRLLCRLSASAEALVALEATRTAAGVG
jgi:hypothetical protein